MAAHIMVTTRGTASVSVRVASLIRLNGSIVGVGYTQKLRQSSRPWPWP